MDDIKDILLERGNRYGTFKDHSRLVQGMKHAAGLYLADTHQKLAPDQIEALEMILHKVGRILNGDPGYIDSWQDIAGYATLVVERLEDDLAVSRSIDSAIGVGMGKRGRLQK